MAKITRPDKDFPIFGNGAAADELTIFGTSTQSTDITLLLTNANSEDGWASGVDANGFPALSWFNAIGHTLSYIAAYYLQNGIPEWVALQEYFIGSKAVASDGFTYVSKTDNNIGNTPVGDSANWRLAFLDSVNTVVYTPTADYHPATKKFVDDSIAAISSVGVLSTDNFFHAQDQKTSGTGGGTSVASPTTRVLNTVITNNISGASLASNQITLPAGDYYIEASAPSYRVTGNAIRLYNITDASVEIDGTSEFTGASGYPNVRATLSRVFTLGASKVLEIQHDCNSAIANGYGNPASLGIVERFTEVKIWKVG